MGKIDLTVWRCTNPSMQGQRQSFPSRFLSNLERYYPTKDKQVLWMFAGGIKPNKNNDTNDIRPETKPTFLCDFKDIPEIKKYDMIIADPPYNHLFAEEWKNNLPKPKHIVEKSARLLKGGGLLLLLHILVIPTYRKTTGFERIALHPVLCGLNNVIRVLNVFQKEVKK